MKAIGYHHNLPVDQPNALEDLQLPAPQPGPRDLLVRVKAISVNPVDTKVRKNTAPPAGEAKVLGWDAVGVVEASTLAWPAGGAVLLRTLVSTGLTETAFTRTSRSRGPGCGAGNSRSSRAWG